MTRQELLNRITAAEFQQWFQLYQMQPWGDFRMDLNSAKLSLLLVQLLADKQSSSRVRLESFLTDWFGEAKQQQAQQNWGRFKQLAAQINRGFEADGRKAGPEGGGPEPSGQKAEKPGPEDGKPDQQAIPE